MRRMKWWLCLASLVVAGAASAANVAIVQGSFYTTDLKTQLQNLGHTVTEVTNYTAASLAPFTLVIHYGNSFTDTTELQAYVQNGGRLLLTPWAGGNFAVPAPIRSIANSGGCEEYSVASPGITILSAGDPLLAGSTPPTAPGSPNIGRFCTVGFEAGATQVLSWADGAAMLGYRTLGTGIAYQLNMHIVTSDTAYQVINQAWAARIVSNMTGAAPAAPPPPIQVPIPFGAVVGAALLLAAFGGWSLRRQG
jgi:hypothetical protein